MARQPKNKKVNKNYRILILEEKSADAELATSELQKAKIPFEAKQVATKEAFIKSLKEFNPHVILSDYALRDFSGVSALRLLKRFNLNIPLVFFTHSLGEDIAVECMREGAADYVFKSAPEELSPALLRALEKNKSLKTEEKTIAALRENEFKLRALLEGMNEALLQVNSDETIEFVNRRFCEMTGYKREELIGRVTTDILFDEEGRKLVEQSNRQQRRGVSEKYELRLKKKNGDMLWTIVGSTPVINSKGVATGSMRVFTDINERKLAEEQLLHDALHDGLTGLANRTLFMDHLRKTIERGKRNKQSLYAVLFLDFDRFKVINDSLGHAEGVVELGEVADDTVAAELGGGVGVSGQPAAECGIAHFGAPDLGPADEKTLLAGVAIDDRGLFAFQ